MIANVCLALFMFQAECKELDIDYNLVQLE